VTLSVSGGPSYKWQQKSGPSVVLSAYNVPNPIFTAPTVSSVTQLTFEVTITRDAKSITKEVTVTVHPAGNLNHTGSALVASAGPDLTAISQEEISLHATVSQSSGGTLSYKWREISTLGLSFDDDTSPSPKVTMPLQLLRAATAKVELTVTDGANTFTDEVDIKIVVPKVAVSVSEVKVDAAPVKVREYLRATVTDAVTPIQYEWTNKYAPTGATAVTLADIEAPSFEPALAGTYGFEVKITDAVGNVATRTVDVTVGQAQAA